MLSLLAWIGLSVVVVAFIGWKEYEDRQRIIRLEKQVEEQARHRWLRSIGLEETGCYFNNEGLRTLILWKLWEMKLLQ